MKNFKLLLGATALLSTGALLVNAGSIIGQETINVRMSVDVIRPLNLTKEKDLYFGKVVVPEGINDITISMDSAGIVSIPSESIGYIEGITTNPVPYVLTQGHRGIIGGATCNQINFTVKNSMTNTVSSSSEGMADRTGPTNTYLSVFCEDADDKANIYANVKLQNDDANLYKSILANITYGGTVYATAVYSDN